MEKIVTRVTNARMMRTVALAATMLVLCLAPDWAQRDRGNRGGQQHSAPAPRYSQPRNENRNFAPQNRQTPRQENRPQFQNAPQQRFPQNEYPQNRAPQYQGGRATPQDYGNRPVFGGNQPAPQNYGNQPAGRQPYSNGSNRQSFAPNGARQPYGGPHLQDWLGRNPTNSVQEQEKQLHNDPSFRRLPQGDQQRLTQQLRSVDRMPEQQRDRRLARNEMLERLSPEERLSINRSGREWSALPADRQTQMRRAFQDLRNVPPDQRQTVLNSSRYQNMFSPQERGILSDFLKVEPYERPQ